MTETFKACFEKLEALTTQELDRSVAELVQVENRNVALVIAHLAELSRRKGDLKLGYPNLFVYCVKKLGLSEGSVALRIQVANVARRFPQVLAALAEGRISLSVAGRLAPHLSEENVEKLLSDCAGMTKHAVEEYLVRLKPQPVFEPSIRKLPTPGERPQSRAENQDRTPRPEEEKCAAPSPGEGSAPLPVPPALPSQPPSPPPGRIIPATPGMNNFRFPASSAFKAKLERLAEVLGIKNLEKNMAQVLEQAVDLALEAKDPQRRLVRREARARRREAALKPRNAAGESRPGDVANGSCPPVESVA